MTPSTIDLFILTFNCANNLINVAVWAAHLKAALSGQGAAGKGNGNALPDLVVFSLQEVAPLAYSFIGPYFLNPYYARYAEALNLAAGQLLEADDYRTSSNGASGSGASGGDPYKLVRAKNVGMTAILLFARDPSKIQQIEEAECGFGAADMGNKGAVGLRVTWSDVDGREDNTIATTTTEEPKTTELTFVATHLAAMEWNLKKRNANWRSIVSGLTFANPREVLPKGEFPSESRAARSTPDRSGAGDTAPPVPRGTQDSSNSADDDDGDSDAQPLLNTNPDHTSTLQSISIFKPTSHLFLAGDLNYRINTTTPPPLATYPSFDPSSANHFSNFLPRDQLTQEREAGRTMHGLSEAPITFGPTYKYDVHPVKGEAVNEESVKRGNKVNGVPEVPWRFASHRWPGWCDRVLYLDVPAWVTTEPEAEAEAEQRKKKVEVEVEAYDSLPVVETSDHRPVFFRAKVPVLGEEEMRVPLLTEEGEGEDELVLEEWKKDPRVSIPMPVDVHAWERRAAARRKEVVVGWTAFFWSTEEGALVLVALLVMGVGSWWLLRDW
ncbi:DNase I-like protein [Neurospora tetraspora]|uniref:DNase I-like protein n=1 Tax=Neurospora tetraspora TaxID=94610 RepID=A0AAE0JPF3_9PEZI|nr:DNase I-like protein [Neurospora tetraspora]